MHIVSSLRSKLSDQFQLIVPLILRTELNTSYSEDDGIMMAVEENTIEQSRLLWRKTRLNLGQERNNIMKS